MFTFGDALGSALGRYVDKTQIHVAARMVRDRRQGSGRFASAAATAALRSVTRRYGLDNVRARRLNESVDIAGIGGERQIEKMRARAILSGV